MSCLSNGTTTRYLPTLPGVTPSQHRSQGRSGMFKGNCPYASQRQRVTHRFCLPALYTCCLCLSFDETCVEFSTFGREYIVYCEYESLILCHNYMLPNQTDYRFVQRARHERKKYIERKRDYPGRNRWYGKWSRYIIVCSPK